MGETSMKMYLTKDEWYPVYGLSNEDRPYLTQEVVDVAPELFEEWQKAEEAFEAVQEKLYKLKTTVIKPTEKVW
jgi:hypothetical protein